MSWLRRRKAPTADREAADPGAVVLRIQGMHCSSCVRLIDAELEELPGVRSARTSRRDARAVVQLDQRGAVHADDLVATVERAGYRAVPIN